MQESAKKIFYFISLLLLFTTTYLRNITWTDDLIFWKDIITKSPLKDRIHHNLGFVYVNQGRLNEAIGEYLTALKINPEFVDAYNNLGVAYFKQGQIDDAIKSFQTAIELKPDFSDARNNLAIAYYNQGKTQEAMKEYEILMRIDPNYVPQNTK